MGNLAGAVIAANRANDLCKNGDLDGAIQAYSSAFQIDPRIFNQALVVSPSFFFAGSERAEVNRRIGRYDKALAELNHIINLYSMHHTDALARIDRAWLYATCPDPVLRNRKQAVADATAACEIDSWDNRDYVGTLAAAFAEAGDFAKAIKFEEKAIRKARHDGTKGAQERLALYQSHRPFRLEPAR